ncbi:MAG: hypothetical protein JEZ08_22490 [Clostridiales bacterium]|nr:hypothetical protein [Clostridiales bacterium]
MSTTKELEVINHYNLSVKELNVCKDYINALRIAMPYIDRLEEIPKYIEIIFTLVGYDCMLCELEEVIINLGELHKELTC